jgi:hypothetical protein
MVAERRYSESALEAVGQRRGGFPAQQIELVSKRAVGREKHPIRHRPIAGADKQRTINVRYIKELALKMLPPDSHLRVLILQESDEVPLESLPTRIGLWLRLNILETQDTLGERTRVPAPLSGCRRGACPYMPAHDGGEGFGGGI